MPCKICTGYRQKLNVIIEILTILQLHARYGPLSIHSFGEVVKSSIYLARDIIIN